MLRYHDHKVKSTSPWRFDPQTRSEMAIKPVIGCVVTQRRTKRQSPSPSQSGRWFDQQAWIVTPVPVHQPSSPSQNGREQIPGGRPLRHMEAGVMGLPDHFCTDPTSKSMEAVPNRAGENRQLATAQLRGDHSEPSAPHSPPTPTPAQSSESPCPPGSGPVE